MLSSGQLSGLRVLVVEDDFFLALDEKAALEDAGADVIGPYGDEVSALEAVEDDIACAVLDLNLGSGPSFKLVAALRARDIPFLFVTGYDDGVILADFLDIIRLRKPIVISELIRRVSMIAGRGP